MNINENLKMKEKTLGKLVSKGVISLYWTPRIFHNGCKFVQWGHLNAKKNIVLKTKCTLVTCNFMISMATLYMTLKNGLYVQI